MTKYVNLRNKKWVVVLKDTLKVLHAYKVRATAKTRRPSASTAPAGTASSSTTPVLPARRQNVPGPFTRNTERGRATNLPFERVSSA